MTDERRKFVDMIVELLNNESGAELQVITQYNNIGVARVDGFGKIRGEWYNLEGYNTLGILRQIMACTQDIQ
jgi:hypothetical protein